MYETIITERTNTEDEAIVFKTNYMLKSIWWALKTYEGLYSVYSFRDKSNYSVPGIRVYMKTK